LYKSRKNKVIDGVCGGIAEYFGIDPVLVRILFVLFFFFGGSAIIAYIVGMIIMPREPLTAPGETEAPAEAAPMETAEAETSPPPSTPGSLIIGIILVFTGGFFLMGNFDFFGGIYWWLRNHFWEYLIPGLIILAGLALIVKGGEK
jgi:phage shock protein C